MHDPTQKNLTNASLYSVEHQAPSYILIDYGQVRVNFNQLVELGRKFEIKSLTIYGLLPYSEQNKIMDPIMHSISFNNGRLIYDTKKKRS